MTLVGALKISRWLRARGDVTRRVPLGDLWNAQPLASHVRRRFGESMWSNQYVPWRKKPDTG